MKIGIPREAKEGERRVGLEPGAAAALARAGHEVRVARGAGLGIGASDEAYRDAGAGIVDPGEAWRCDLVVKVKEIQPGESASLVKGSTLFSFQHLVGEPELAREIAASGVTAIAYEMVRGADGGFPLLAPMSMIAGRLAIQVGAQLLTLPEGGNGTLLAGCPGAEPARVLVLGGGHAGANAAEVAAALGAKVVVLTRSAGTRDALAARLGTSIETGLATPEAIERHALAADLVVGAVFVPGEPTPRLLPKSLVRRMKPGSVIVDISIDAGGVAETSRPTTHASPTFVEEGVVHYCVANMPSAVARAGAAALSAAALPFVQALAGKGIARAIREDAALRAGVLVWKGRLAHEGIAREAGLAWAPLSDADLGVPMTASDDIVGRIDALLPQTQCTKCGYAGCRPYAEAIARGEADIDQCPPGGDAGVGALAALLDRAVTPLDPAHGEFRPPQVAVIDERLCIGCVKCIHACPVDAIVGASKLMHTVVSGWCTGCELCIPPCPVDCISLVPVAALPDPGRSRERHAFRAFRLTRDMAERAAKLEACE